MRRTIIIFIVLSLFVTCGCTQVSKNGLDSFQKETCSVGLTANMFPCDDFLSKFRYVDGNYYYLDNGDWTWGHVKTLAYLQYTSDIYHEAKKYCLDIWISCEKHQFKHNEYVFEEHLCYEAQCSDGEYQVTCRYPEIMSMWGYNDQNNTLVFFGYYNGDPNAPEREQAEMDFPQFLKSVYSEYYLFSEP